MAIMRGFEGRLGPVVVHCFTGTHEELFDYLDHDWYIGITGWLQAMSAVACICGN